MESAVDASVIILHVAASDSRDVIANENPFEWQYELENSVN
jgi:hypothetical protein